jgi:hypothetical protein
VAVVLVGPVNDGVTRHDEFIVLDFINVGRRRKRFLTEQLPQLT